MDVRIDSTRVVTEHDGTPLPARELAKQGLPEHPLLLDWVVYALKCAPTDANGVAPAQLLARAELVRKIYPTDPEKRHAFTLSTQEQQIVEQCVGTAYTPRAAIAVLNTMVSAHLTEDDR